jgi:hypothetical protein
MDAWTKNERIKERQRKEEKIKYSGSPAKYQIDATQPLKEYFSIVCSSWPPFELHLSLCAPPPPHISQTL